MALKLAVTRPQNFQRADYPAAYHRVLDVRSDLDLGKVFVRVRAYSDEGARRYSDPAPQDRGPMPTPGMMGGDRKITEDQTLEFSRADFKAAIKSLPDTVEHEDMDVAAAYVLLKTKTEKFRLAEDI
jgi:hypothetical protein